MILAWRLIVECFLVPDVHISVAFWTATIFPTDVIVIASVEGHLPVIKLAVPPEASFFPSDVFRLDGHIERCFGGKVLPWQWLRSLWLFVWRGKGDLWNDEAVADDWFVRGSRSRHGASARQARSGGGEGRGSTDTCHSRRVRLGFVRGRGRIRPRERCKTG